MTTKRGHGLSLSAVTFWLFAEALFASLSEIKRKLENIMALVSIDDSVLAQLTTLAQTVDTEVKALIAAGTVQPGDVSGITAALNDADSALQAAANPTPPAQTG